MHRNDKREWYKGECVCSVIHSSISYVHGTEHTPWHKCMPQWNVCFYLLIFHKTPSWNQEIEGTAVLLRPLKLCPGANVFNGFLIIHWIVISFNEFSCRSIHRWGKSNTVLLNILPFSAAVEGIWKQEERVFSSGKKISENYASLMGTNYNSTSLNIKHCWVFFFFLLFFFGLIFMWKMLAE